MTIKIITDSTADLLAMLTEELDVKVVPVYLRFGGRSRPLDYQTEPLYLHEFR